jgi:hypothetical protein
MHANLKTFIAVAITSALATPWAYSGETPRTGSGKPDLSGSYDISSLTPFQRPELFGNRLFLSREEAEAIEQKAALSRTTQAQSSNPNRAAPDSGGNVGAYNDFWFEWGTAAFAIDGKFRTSILTDPANGRMPELTEAGKLRLTAEPRFAWQNLGEAWWLESGDTPYDGPENMVLGVRCLYQPTASVPIRPLPYNNLKTIVQTDSHVMLNIEWMHWARVIRMDAEHLPADIRSLGGDSIGWWEGDTLVVETTNFLALPSQPKDGLRVLERFSAIGDEGLLYQFTVEDPDYSGPYSGELLWPKTTARSFEYACHEGNYAMGNTLRGARRLEADWHAKQQASSGE